MANISLNPMVTTNALGSFGVQSQGWYQGVALDDPAIRFSMAAGYVSAAETLPMWGGLPITEMVPGVAARPVGAEVRRATALANLTGFSVFNQANNGLVTPQSTVPTYSQDMSVSFYRLGSGARVPLPVSAAIIQQQATGLPVNYPVSWNFITGQIDKFTTIAADTATTALTFTNGVATGTTAGAHNLVPGSVITIADAVPAQYNGTVVVTSVPSATTFTYVPAAAPAGNATTQGEISATDSADYILPVRILGIQQGNCKVVVYDPTQNYANWTQNGNLVLIEL